ncbi:hypothetical protein BaOVIS_012420 [Babesia ovis]|uniref:PH domain-containing protein n=1 Tax=Babesia ovis TaxID=5869 RepID=A0A9W5TBT3_BABOV|nr:hypothetical protein BaOVIS_012420 [Babesia ovis]
MKVIEFRIPLPISLEMFQRCSLYLVTQASIKEVETGSAFEIVTNEPCERNGLSGRHSIKRYHFGKNLPSWLQAILGKELTVVSEESWATFPYIFTKYTNKKLSSFQFSFESMNYDGLEQHENALNLNEKDLSRRKVIVLDLSEFKKCKLYNAEWDVTLAKSQYTDVLPMPRGWLNEPGRSGIVSYKVLKIDIPYFGFLASKIENFMVNYLQDRMMAYLSHAVSSIDEWYHANMDELRIKEEECYDLLNQRFLEQHGHLATVKASESALPTSAKDADTSEAHSSISEEERAYQPKRNSWDISDSIRDVSKEDGMIVDQQVSSLSHYSGNQSVQGMVCRATDLDIGSLPPIERRWSTGSTNNIGSARRLSIPRTADGRIDNEVFWDCLENLDDDDSIYVSRTAYESPALSDSSIIDDKPIEPTSVPKQKTMMLPEETAPTETGENSFTNEAQHSTIVEEPLSTERIDSSSSSSIQEPYFPDKVQTTDDSCDSSDDHPDNTEDMCPELSTVDGQNDPLTFTGYLYKLGGTLFYQWNMRYIVIRDGTMCYYDKCKDTHPKYTIELANARISWVGEYMRRQNVFTLVTKHKRIFYWCADNEMATKRWILLLQLLSEESPEPLISGLSTEYLYRHVKSESTRERLPQSTSETNDVI